jgi:FUN14 domain-containing protein 1
LSYIIRICSIGIVGFCSGIFVKKGFRAAVGTAGGLFVLFQVAHSQGYVDIHLEKIEKDVMKIIDTNNDGKIDQQDARLYLNRTVSLLTHDTKLSAGKSLPTLSLLSDT